MTQRKQTPDVLAEILGGGQPAATNELPDFPAPRPAKVKSAAKSAAKPSSTPRAPAPRQPVAATGWQYRVVSFQEYKGWRARFVDGVEIPDWTTSPRLHEYLQQLADQGWELVSAASGERLFGSSDRHQLYLRKRR